MPPRRSTIAPSSVPSLLVLVWMLGACTSPDSAPASPSPAEPAASVTPQAPASERAADGACAVELLPVSARGGGAPPVPEVQIAAAQLCYQGKPVAGLVDGTFDAASVRNHLVVPLGDAIEAARTGADQPGASTVEREGQSPELRPVRILAPPSLPFSALVDTLYTVGRGGFMQYYLGVAAPGGEPGFLRVDPPKFAVISDEFPPKGPRQLRVFIGDDALRVQLEDDLREIPLADAARSMNEPARWDSAALRRAVGEIKQAHPDVVHAVISAHGKVSVGVLVGVLDVIAGEGCPAHTDPYEVAVERCWFPYYTLEAGVE